MTVGIVVAMDKEVAPFLKGKNATEIRYGKYSVFNFKLAGKDIYLIRQYSVGEICAAGATQILITKFGADVILNFGVVGAYQMDSVVFRMPLDTVCPKVVNDIINIYGL